jgi:hypothetical protein
LCSASCPTMSMSASQCAPAVSLRGHCGPLARYDSVTILVVCDRGVDPTD